MTATITRTISDIGQPIHVYTCCPYCGGDLQGYPRLAHPHGHRTYVRCRDCTYGVWQWEMAQEIARKQEAVIQQQVATRAGRLGMVATVNALVDAMDDEDDDWEAPF